MFKQQYLLLFFLLSLFACANIGSPKGGPLDEEPPVLNTKASTANYQTNFKKQDLEFVFNEFVDLKDVFKQVVISPPLQKQWKLSKKLKTVKFTFDKEEELRPDATYTINFGDAVVDYTAGNIVEDFRFVFSTGAYIDSMEVSGKIINSETNKPEADVFLLLFDNLADSVVRTERPFYFAKTDKEGKYKIQNVKQDTFKAFAIKDEGQRYLFDQVTEMIGFPDSFIVLNQIKETLPEISLFLEEPPLQLIPPRNKTYGKINLAFNRPPYDVKVKHDSIGQIVYYETEEDSIKVWYSQNDTLAWDLFIEQGEDFRDTFRVEPPNKTNFLETDSLKRSNIRKAALTKVNPTKSIKILFNHPLERTDTSNIFLLEDSIYTRVVPSLKIDGRELTINYKWKENMTYQLDLLPGAITDIFDLVNQDSIRQNYQVMERKAFGDINLKVNDLDSTQHYVINLFFKNKTNLVETNRASGVSSFEKYFATVPEGQYLIEIIIDENNNGRWDTGNYDLQLQPEAFYIEELDELRPNWEVDARSISLEELARPKTAKDSAAPTQIKLEKPN